MASERSKKDTSTKNKCYKELVNTTTPYEQSIAAKLEQVPFLRDSFEFKFHFSNGLIFGLISITVSSKFLFLSKISLNFFL